MSDAKRTLTVDEIAERLAEEGLSDWRHVMDRLRARYRMPNYAAGLEFVARVGAQAEARDHHPDLTLSYGEVLVSTHSHDVRGITRRDLDLAVAVTGIARELGATPDTAGLTQLDLGLDTGRGEELAPFYAALLGSEVSNGEPVDPSGQVPTVWWQEPGDPDDDGALPEPEVPQRWHFDVWVPVDEGERRVQAALAAGGRLVSDESAPSFWVIEDAEGNRSCVCTVAGR